MPTFDADAYRAAREPFTLTLNGRTHVARPVSAELVIAVQPMLDDPRLAVRTKALHRLLRAAFPRTVAMWWLGDPVEHALSLDRATRNALIARFFRFLGDDGRESPPATPGTT